MKLARGDGLFRVEETKRKAKRRYHREEGKEGKEVKERSREDGGRGKYKKRRRS
jgi:hypothetical protein